MLCNSELDVSSPESVSGQCDVVSSELFYFLT